MALVHKVLVIHTLIFWLAHAQQTSPLTAWVINITASSPSFYPPGVTNTASCVPVGYLYPYMATNYTFSSDGVREIIIITDGDLPSFIAVYYGGFNPMYPCTNFERYARNLITTGPHIDDFFYFKQDIPYFFVITVRPPTVLVPYQQGFVLNIFESTAQGNSNTTNVWNTLEYDNNDNQTCTTTDYMVSFDTYIWNQPTSGLFDIVGGFEYYPGELIEISLGLFYGVVSNSVLINDPCSVFLTGNQSFAATSIYAVPLVAGANYTLVISGGLGTSHGNYGVQILPTRTYEMQTGWIAPNFSFPCTPALPLNTTNWVSLYFTASYHYVFVSAKNAISFVYSGDNYGNSTNPPETCPSSSDMLAFSYIDQFSFSTIPTRNYTIIVTTTFDEFSSVELYVLSGPSVSLPSSILATGTGASTLLPITTSSMTSSSTRFITTSTTNLTSTSHSSTDATTSCGSLLTTSLLNSLVLLCIVVIKRYVLM